jgi:hypothetical protein
MPTDIDKAAPFRCRGLPTRARRRRAVLQRPRRDHHGPQRRPAYAYAFSARDRRLLDGADRLATGVVVPTRALTTAAYANLAGSE